MVCATSWRPAAFAFVGICAIGLIVSVSACSAPRLSAEPGRTTGAPPSSPVGRATAAPEQVELAAVAAAKTGDTVPNADGWGRAAGLRYLEMVRGGASPDESLPLLILIHGLGDRPHRSWVRAIDVAPPIKARMILPQAPTPYGRGFAWFEQRFRDHDDVALARGIRRAEANLSHMIDRLQRIRPTRGRPVVCGFSQGAMLSYALAVQHPDQVEFALPISGELPPQLWPLLKPTAARVAPIVALHGTADRVVSFEADADFVAHLRSLAYPAELVAFEGVGHRISRAMSVRVTQTLSAALLRQRLDH